MDIKRAIIITKPNQAGVEEVSYPEPGPEEVTIKVKSPEYEGYSRLT
jgi:D-arabinose 1-dehydrogenase-like Zn-dependent alcohol dehydrogenase